MVSQTINSLKQRHTATAWPKKGMHVRKGHNTTRLFDYAHGAQVIEPNVKLQQLNRDSFSLLNMLMCYYMLLLTHRPTSGNV